MELKQLFADNRAVSPVIGVILMVAITVILAAVIGTFVLGLGDQVSNTTPSASFEFDFTDEADGDANDTLTMTHGGGDKIDGARLNATMSDAVDSSGGDPVSVQGDVFTGSVSAGTSDTIDETTTDVPGGETLVLDGATVRIVWTAESGGDSAVLGKWSGPDA